MDREALEVIDVHPLVRGDTGATMLLAELFLAKTGYAGPLCEHLPALVPHLFCRGDWFVSVMTSVICMVKPFLSANKPGCSHGTLLHAGGLNGENSGSQPYGSVACFVASSAVSWPTCRNPALMSD